MQDIVNRLLMNAASQPELEETEQEQPEIEEMPNGQQKEMQMMQEPIELEQQSELPPDVMLPNLTNTEQDNIV